MRALIHDIIDGMRAQPGRLALAFLAVMTGMIALTVQRALSAGLDLRARRLVDELGAHVVALVAREQDPKDGAPTLRARHADLLEANLEGRPVTRVRADRVTLEGDTHPVTVMATDQYLAPVRRWTLHSGRFLDAVDIHTGARHVVLTTALAARKNLGVGHLLLVDQVPFTVVGIVKTEAGGIVEDPQIQRIQTGSDALFVPARAPLPWLPRSPSEHLPLQALFVGGTASDDPGALAATCRRVLGAPGLECGDYDVITPDSLLDGLRRLQRALRWSAGGIAALCLLLGGTSLMSLMLANVRDRVGEIGLRRALGGTQRDVAALFIVESCLLTLTATLAGGGVAAILLVAAGDRLPVPFVREPEVFLVPLLASLILGTIFSWAPARLAARISPSEALRNE